MKRRIILWAVGLVLVSGCSSKMKENQTVMTEAANEFNSLVDKVAMSESESVVWNGTAATIIERDVDDGTIEDKHYPPTQLFIETDQWDLVTDTIGEVVSENDSSKKTKLIGDTCMIEVYIPDSYEIAATELIHLPDHINIDTTPIVVGVKKKYQTITCYRGLIETNNKTMAGYTAVLETVWGTPFVLRYYGIGDMSNIDYYFGSMIGSFHEKKDIDELKKELGIDNQ